ncbi:hypothetical protein, partial [Rhodopirellula sallentina]
MNPSDSFQPDDSSDPRENGIEDTDDAMFEALLSEALRGDSPPDQSRVILQRLDDHIASRSKPQPGATKTPFSQSNPGQKWSLILSAVALITLVVGTTVGIRYRNPHNVAQNPAKPAPGDAGEALVAGESLASDESPGSGGDLMSDPSAVATTGAGNQGQPTGTPENTSTPQDQINTLPSRSIDLADNATDADAIADKPFSLFEHDQAQRTQQTNTPRPAPRTLTLVSNVMTNRLERHWGRVGVQPTQQLPADKVSERLSSKFGIRLTPESVNDSKRMLAALSRPENTNALAPQVLSAIASRPLESLNSSSDKLMAKQVSETLRSGSGFDRLIASWFTERESVGGKRRDAKNNPANRNSKPSASFHELLRPLGEHETLVTTAAVTLAADVRCQRCHDLSTVSNENRTITQHDYWQLAATLSPWIPIRPNSDAGRFYDLPDGRRRLAEADQDAEWPEQLIGSRSLAEGLVGVMWKMVHGRPLASSPYDLSGGVGESDLRVLRDELADDLLASDFNLLRTISLLMTDSIVSRSTPEAMTASGVLTATDNQWIDAVAAVESFAAAPPETLPTSQGHRMRLVQESDLPQLGLGTGKSVLAQPLGRDESESDEKPRQRPGNATPKTSPAVLAGLPMRPTVVMPAWINELPDFESRLDHIAHLAGLRRTPESAQKLARQMQDAGVEE